MAGLVRAQLQHIRFCSTTAIDNPVSEKDTQYFLTQIKHPSAEELEKEAQYYEARAYYLRHRTELLKSNPFQFAAVSRDRVIAFGATKSDVINELDDLREAGKQAPPVIIVMIGLEDQQAGPLYTSIFPSSKIPDYIVPAHEVTPLVTSLDLLPNIQGEGERQTVWDSSHPRFSHHQRPYLTLRVKVNREDPHFVPLTFLVDTGSPSTYIASETIAKLGLIDVSKDNSVDQVYNEGQAGYRAYIEGQKAVIQPSELHRNLYVVGANKYINLLGTDILRSRKLIVDWRGRNIEWI